MRLLKLFFPLVIAVLIIGIIVGDNVIQRQPKAVAVSVEDALEIPSETAAGLDHQHGSELIDPVCHMLVGKQIAATYRGKAHYFCAPQCRDAFVKSPDSFLSEVCPVCDVDDGKRTQVSADTEWAFTWEDQTCRFCSKAHRDTFAADPGGYFLHRMWGIPNWLYYLSIALVMLVSFGLLEGLERLRTRKTDAKDGDSGANEDRIDLLAWPFVRKLFQSRFLRFSVQAFVVLLFFMIILTGLWGSQHPGRNIAPILTWTLWWAGLVVLILYAGKAFCWACPWDAVSSWIERLSFWKWKIQGLGLGLKWPRGMRNIALATFMFVGLTWVELGFGVTLKPQATAWLALGMLAMSFLAVMVFERKSFCRYACLVGRVSGLYALFSPLEMRPISKETCTTCNTKDCYVGNEKGSGCPTFEFPSNMKVNTYCTLCTECLNTCPHDNMTIKLRPWGADLNHAGTPRKDEAYLALLMLSITGFHGLTMTGLWLEWTKVLSQSLNLSYTISFSLGMFLLMSAPLLVYAALVWISKALASGNGLAGQGPSYKTYFIRYAYALLPIALFYHLAHNAGHMLMEGQKVIPMFSNPFGFALGEQWNVMGFSGVGPWNLFGTVDAHVPPLVSLPALWLIQVLLVLVGHVYSLWAARNVSRALFESPGQATRSQIPMLLAMVLFSVFSLWLLKQPMEMRISAM